MMCVWWSRRRLNSQDRGPEKVRAAVAVAAALL